MCINQFIQLSIKTSIIIVSGAPQVDDDATLHILPLQQRLGGLVMYGSLATPQCWSAPAAEHLLHLCNSVARELCRHPAHCLPLMKGHSLLRACLYSISKSKSNLMLPAAEGVDVDCEGLMKARKILVALTREHLTPLLTHVPHSLENTYLPPSFPKHGLSA